MAKLKAVEIIPPKPIKKPRTPKSPPKIRLPYQTVYKVGRVTYVAHYSESGVFLHSTLEVD